MKIGFVRQESFVKKDKEGNKQEHKWLECHFRMAGVRPFKAKMVKNKNTDHEKAPDYNIYLRGNEIKGDTFRDIPIGALWIGSNIFDGVEKTFMTGYIESPLFRKQSISVWKAEKYFENEELGFLYEISTMKEKGQTEDNQDYGSYGSQTQTPSNAPDIEINEDEIPF